ncbi:type II toxin-antitoxin system RelB/DinJ family antitoxin [Patescibacteria group bacterium]|nr:type II toxin-antitoxin system RelB/DinJ family antitoxin [Patescibacteria group bacterium]
MAHLHVRTNDNTKKKAMEILESLGLDLSTAINLYLEKIIISEGIPFSICRHPICSDQIKVPDHIMEQWAKEEEEALKEGKIYNSADDLFDSK